MAKSKIQQILSSALSRRTDFCAAEFVPVWYRTDKKELRIGDPVSECDISIFDPDGFSKRTDVVYEDEDLSTREGKESVKESLSDIAEGKDVRVFVYSPAGRKNGKDIIFEYSAYFQFDKFLNNVSTYTKLKKTNNRIKFQPSCQTVKHNINKGTYEQRTKESTGLDQGTSPEIKCHEEPTPEGVCGSQGVGERDEGPQIDQRLKD